MVEMMMMFIYYICERLKLEGETENMGVCTKERKGVTAVVLMATPCTNSQGGESGGHKHGRERKRERERNDGFNSKYRDA